MSLPTPNLDDRTWKQIVEEAKKIIPGLCPHWTDFNPSDPGITLVELMGWMTELLIYRLNLVPEKNFIKFLELLGVSLTPPRPASTWLEFTPSEGSDPKKLSPVPANTRVSGKDSKDQLITFETTSHLNLNTSRLTYIYTQTGERFTDRTKEILEPEAPSPKFNLFQEKDEVPHIFYLGDPCFSKVGTEFSLRLSAQLEQPGAGLDIQWSVWNGQKWQPISPALDETSGFIQSGDILFTMLPPIQPAKVNGTSSYWMRLKLEGYTGSPLPRFNSFKKTLELKKQSGIMPEYGFFSNADIPFLPVMFQGRFKPFGSQAKQGDTFYIGSEVFSRKGIRVAIDVGIADISPPLSDDLLDKLKLSWEYFSTSGEWKPLGITTPQGTIRSAWAFIDHTEAFTHSGSVRFNVPTDITSLVLNGMEQHWVRITIKSGNYGEKKKINPPILERFLLHYREKPSDFDHYFSFDNYSFRDITHEVAQKNVFEPYIQVYRTQPELLMGFDTPFTNKLHTLYFRLEQKESSGSHVIWEYFSPDGWKQLNLVQDETRHFTQSGFVKLVAPADWTIRNKFGKQAYWFRVSWKKHDPDAPPELNSLHTNAVKAINAVSHKNESLGSGNGLPFQQFSFINSPILKDPHPRIIVKELESTIPKEIDDFKKKTKEKIIDEIDPDTNHIKALWVVWEEQPNFYYSERDSRHYLLDAFKGTVTFGDGIRGRLLPIGQGNVKAQVYYSGGGGNGNLGRNTLTSLDEAIPNIENVTNPYPAAGGCPMETLEEAKLRGPWILKHRQRAVTIDDFQQMAEEATGEVARSYCEATDEGTVKILIIPKERPNDKGKPEASPELCDVVKRHLDQHRLITTWIEVYGPKYVDISIRMEIGVQNDYAHLTPQIRQQVEDMIKEFLHPLRGGMKGKGYPIARAVHIGEVYQLAENVTGIDYIENVILDHTPGKNRIPIPAGSFPYLADIDIRFKGS